MPNLQTFYILAATQTLSLIGSRMTTIALGIYIFNTTDETTPLLMAAFFAEIPGMVGGSFAGVLADRWDRRYVMILADAGGALCTLALALSFVSGSFQLWHLYAVALAQGIFGTLQGPATDASITMLVPDSRRERANAIRQMAFPLAGIIAPMLAGLLFRFVGVVGVMVVDLLTFAAAVTVVYLIRIPRPTQSDEGREAQGSFWREFSGGFRYLLSRRALLGLVLYFAFINFLLNGPLELAIPYLITVTGDEAVAGALLGVMSAGAFAGALVIAVWSGTRPRIHTIFVGMLLTGAMFLLFATANSTLLLGASLFVLMMPLPLTNALLMSILQVKTPPDLQGRVFAVVGQLLMIATPISFLITGPLVDKTLEPAVATPAWNAFAPLVGNQAGAGMRLVLFAVGLIILVTTALAYALPVLRHMESTLPDYAIETE